jgi:hypothetical protein
VAIAIVAETCNPFTVLPALMNEYRVPELNVQNGVLKVRTSPSILGPVRHTSKTPRPSSLHRRLSQFGRIHTLSF